MLENLQVPVCGFDSNVDGVVCFEVLDTVDASMSFAATRVSSGVSITIWIVREIRPSPLMATFVMRCPGAVNVPYVNRAFFGRTANHGFVLATLRMYVPFNARFRTRRSMRFVRTSSHVLRSNPHSRAAWGRVRHRPGISRYSPSTRRSASRIAGVVRPSSDD